MYDDGTVYFFDYKDINVLAYALLFSPHYLYVSDENCELSGCMRGLSSKAWITIVCFFVRYVYCTALIYAYAMNRVKKLYTGPQS